MLQWPDVLALMGDTSDNVPGLKGIGPKGALALIQEYGSVDAALDNAGEVGALCSANQGVLNDAKNVPFPNTLLACPPKRHVAVHAQVKRKKQREELQSVEGAQKAHLSKKLVTIQTGLDLPPVR